jgi:phosphoglycolate phosphatase-like HAD superfamily hydrolase
VLNQLAHKKNNQNFVLVSATPEKELHAILNNIKIHEIFDKVFGSPTLKVDAIKSFLESQNLDSRNAVMIGDSSADYDASLANGIDFVLRCHEGNGVLQNSFNGIKIKDFLF